MVPYVTIPSTNHSWPLSLVPAHLPIPCISNNPIHQSLSAALPSTLSSCLTSSSLPCSSPISELLLGRWCPRFQLVSHRAHLYAARSVQNKVPDIVTQGNNFPFFPLSTLCPLPDVMYKRHHFHLFLLVFPPLEPSPVIMAGAPFPSFLDKSCLAHLSCPYENSYFVWEKKKLAAVFEFPAIL